MKRGLLLPIAIAVAAPAGGAGAAPPPPPAPPGPPLRVAIMMGSRGATPLPVGTRPAAENRAFDDWDPTADNPELQRLLGLRQLAELARATVRLAPGETSFTLTMPADRRLWELGATVTETGADIVYLSIDLKEDGRVVSQPRMGLKLGQKGVACARVTRGRDEAFVFFVLQVDRA